MVIRLRAFRACLVAECRIIDSASTKAAQTGGFDISAVEARNARMFKPLHDYLLILPAPRKQSDVIQVISREPMNRGTVVAAGPGKWLRIKSGLVHELESGVFLPNTVKMGDFVTYTDLDIFPKWRERDGGEQFVIIQTADVCWIEDPEQRSRAAVAESASPGQESSDAGNVAPRLRAALPEERDAA